MVFMVKEGNVQDVPDSLYDFMLQLGYVLYLDATPNVPNGWPEPEEGAVPRYAQGQNAYVPYPLASLVDDVVTDATPQFEAEFNATYARSHQTHAYTMLGIPRAWDNFVRPNATDLNGLSLPSRHVWETGNGGTNRMANTGHRLVPTGVTETGSANGVGIGYVQDDRPIMSLAAEWVWDNTGASTGFQNMVLGLCKRRFSFGSIQLAYYAISQPGQPLIQWELFCVGNPTLYTPIASGPFSPFDITGATKYGASINRTDTNQITIIHPDGSPQEVNDTNVDPVTGRSLIDTYAGSKVGLQLRRNYLTDGALSFLSMATAEAA